MRRFNLAALGVLALLSLTSCGGPIADESVPAEPAGNEVEAMYACPIDRPCPGTTVCVNGLCRNCTLTPQFCQ